MLILELVRVMGIFLRDQVIRITRLWNGYSLSIRRILKDLLNYHKVHMVMLQLRTKRTVANHQRVSI